MKLRCLIGRHRWIDTARSFYDESHGHPVPTRELVNACADCPRTQRTSVVDLMVDQ